MLAIIFFYDFSCLENTNIFFTYVYFTNLNIWTHSHKNSITQRVLPATMQFLQTALLNVPLQSNMIRLVAREIWLLPQILSRSVRLNSKRNSA